MDAKEKIVWLVDGAYLFNAQRSVGPDYAFDYAKLRRWLEQDGEIRTAYFLNSTPNPPLDSQDKFHLWLKSAKPQGPHMRVLLYQLKEQRAKCPECEMEFTRPVQKGVDVGLATLIVKLAHRDEYDTLLLSSGDGDLKDAVDYVCGTLGKNVNLCVFRDSVSADLQSYANRIYWINEFAEEVRRIIPSGTV